MAADKSVKGVSRQASVSPKASSSGSADSGDSSTQAKKPQEINPPDKNTKPKGAVGWMPQTKSIGSNLSALQSFQSDPFTGRASFSIPIDAPGGRKGIQPNLSLLYASGQANGIAGVGWSLELGAIEVSTRKGTAKYDGTDSYIFSSSGVNAELVKASGSQYRPEIESSFSKFAYDGSSWVVTDKSGIKYYFGQTSSSRQDYGSKVFRWSLNRVEDLYNNYLTISYTKEDNQLYPSRISYTGNSGNSLEPAYSVQFSYESRSDSIINYRPGFKATMAKRLSEIKVKYQDEQVRRYVLSYATSQNSRSLLSSVKTYGQDNNISLPEISFEYQQQSQGWQASGTSYSIPPYANFDSGCVIVDVNNDTYPDIIRKRYYGDNYTENHSFLFDSSVSAWKETTNWQISPHIWSYTGDQGVRFADINGDGWVDLVQNFQTKEGGVINSINLNNKQSGWESSSGWSFPSGKYIAVARYDEYHDWHESQGVILADLNSDGYADYVYCRSDSRITYLNNKSSGWSENSSWALPDGDLRDGTQLVDLNADGLLDLVIASDTSSLGRKTYLNTGGGWARESSLDPPSDANINDNSTQFADVNNDGLADILINKGSSLRKTYINTGLGWKEDSSWKMTTGDFTDGTRVLDVNSDGQLDFIHHPTDSETSSYINPSPYPELLKQIDSGIGGSIEITYKSSSQYSNSGSDTQSDLSFPIYAVSQSQLSDGRGNSYSTNYSYKDGVFDFSEREFRGFGYCKVTDSDGNYSESYFKQDSVYKGKPYKQETRDSGGNLYAKAENTWSKKELYSGVNFAYVSQADSYIYDGDSSYKQTRLTYEYDDYGNPAKVQSQGNVSESGDERTLTTEYSYNTSDWIVGLPKSVKLADASGERVTQRWFYYDGADSYDASASHGLLTKEEAWLYNSQDASEKKLSSQYSYDSYGNLTKATNSKGYATTTEYDSTLHSYPTKITNSKGHTLNNEYDYQTGQVTKSTDSNSQATEYRYDSLGRLTSAIGPKDSESLPGISYEYNLSSQPIKVTKKVKSDYSGNYLATYQFSDGLGRMIETKSPAQDESYQVVSGIVTYDSKGQVNKQYLPYLVSNDSSFSSPSYSGYYFSFDYDPVGRLTQNTNPDGSYSSTSYSDWTTTKTDENGNYHTYYNDAYGRLTKVEEHNDSQVYTTTYTYDIQGNLTKVKDAKGNTSSIYYDSLGRKVKMDDPDMGVWSYEYDDLGNLTKQTDAKEQVLEFEYDELNRLTKKKVTSPESKTLVSYTYDDSSKENYKGRLSKISDQSGSTEFWYDSLGRETKSTKTIDSTSYSVEKEYDTLDRLTKLKYPDSNYLEYTYSAQGPTKVRNGYMDKDYVKEVNYNASGQITYIKYGNDVETNYTYDEKTLRLSTLKTEGSQGTLQNLSYEFYSNGNVKGITDSQYGSNQSFSYDNLNRLTSASGSYGSIDYSYDSIGNMLSNGSTTYSYNSDKPHALSGLSDGSSFEYDSNGNLKEKTTSESKTINYTYDYENRLTKTSPEGSDESVSASVSLTLNPGWNFFALPLIPESLEISSVFSSIFSKYNQISRYNPKDEKFEHYVKNSDFNQFTSLEYGRGYQVYISSLSSVSLTVSGKTSSDQMTKSLKKGWNLIGCPSKNSITVKSALNNLERDSDYDSLQEYYTDSKKYIAMGTEANMIVGQAYFIHCLKDASWKLSYDQDATSATTNFTYDGDGGRVKKYVSSSGLTTTYVGSLYEVDSQDSAKKHIYLGSQRVLTVNGLQEPHYYHSDHLGSSNVISDADGKKEQRIEYYPYGKTYLSDGTKTTNYKYTGKEEDPTTALYFYGARYYDPDIGRFITPDTIVPNPYNPQDLNRYSYCNNNPINYTDPSGHKWSWKKFWNSFAGGVVAALVAVIASPFIWPMLTGAIAGAAGGATTAGLSGQNAGDGALWGAAFGLGTGILGEGVAGIFKNVGRQIFDAGVVIASGITAYQQNGAEGFWGGVFGSGLVTGISSGFTYGEASSLSEAPTPRGFWETFWDITSFCQSIKQFNDTPSFMNGLGLIADSLALLAPGVPGGAGIASKVINKGDDLTRVRHYTNKAGKEAMEQAGKLNRHAFVTKADAFPKGTRATTIESKLGIGAGKGKYHFDLNVKQSDLYVPGVKHGGENTLPGKIWQRRLNRGYEIE